MVSCDGQSTAQFKWVCVYSQHMVSLVRSNFGGYKNVATKTYRRSMALVRMSHRGGARTLNREETGPRAPLPPIPPSAQNRERTALITSLLGMSHLLHIK